LNIAIVGAGKVGTALGKVLSEQGERITCVVSRTAASAKAAAKFMKCKAAATSLDTIPTTTDLVLIATPHEAVREVAIGLAALGHLRFKKLSVCHASGMLTAEVLSPLEKQGATVFSFHPLQTFPREFAVKKIVPRVRGIYYGVDGGTRGIAKAKQLARRLRGNVIVIPPEMRAFYHAACVVASNHLTTMLWILEQMFAVLKTKEKDFYPVFRPIIEATLLNVAESSPTKALTGPIARGGVETVAEHFEALQRYAPNLVSYYGSVSAETIRCAEAKGSLDREKARALYNVIFSNMRM
jgi:predicted short-subunit dehydrogenase-like oxidoreductase (DUF2520 family)